MGLHYIVLHIKMHNSTYESARIHTSYTESLASCSGGLEDKDPKTYSGFSPKIMQKQSKPDSLKDQDPKSKISKINFTSWIRGFRRHSSHPFF